MWVDRHSSSLAWRRWGAATGHHTENQRTNDQVKRSTEHHECPYEAADRELPSSYGHRVGRECTRKTFAEFEADASILPTLTAALREDAKAMLFSAVHACPRCLLRFERRSQCPECGGNDIASLASASDRERFRKLVRKTHPEARSGAFQTFLFRVSEWVPERSWISLAFGALMLLPLIVYLAGGTDSFRDRDPWYEGLSATGAQVIALGVLGVLVASLALVPSLAARAVSRRGRAPANRTLRVFSPPRTAPGTLGTRAETRVALEGKIRLATAECTSPLGETPCVVFGLVGVVNGCSIDDADGGDFDVELASGERVFVSLEHAVLRVEQPREPEEVSLTAALDDLFAARGVGSMTTECRLDELVLCDGDEIVVEGEISGSAAVSVAYRSGGGPRVVAGDEHAPLVVFPTNRRR